MNIMEAILFGHDCDFSPRQCEPTAEVPGTRGKLDVLVQRAASGVALWHTNDAKDYETTNDHRANDTKPIPSAR
jgi:hypothetical protein